MKKQVDRAAFERYRQEHDRCLAIAVCELRTDKGLTRIEVAKRANVSVLWIQRLETNQLHTKLHDKEARPGRPCVRSGTL